jgi:hypothetical protein
MAKQYGKAHKSQAQSGGRNSTFGGGKGGGVWQGAGAASKTGVKKKTKLGNQTGVNVRSPGGDNALQGSPSSASFGSRTNGPYKVPKRTTSLPKELGGSV